MKKLIKFNDYKLYEFEEVKDIPPADRLSFMKILEEKIVKFLNEYSNKFKVNSIPGKIITIDTGNKKDLKIVIRLENDKIYFDARPTQGPSFEFNYTFNKNGIDEVFRLVQSSFDEDPNKGIAPEHKSDTYKSDTDEPSEDITEDDVEPLDIPITNKKPLKRTRSININIIQDVLEDAFILDDIDLKDTPVEELIRRMLLESRRKSK
jgi:hypothetical protein